MHGENNIFQSKDSYNNGGLNEYMIDKLKDKYKDLYICMGHNYS